jgi:T-complex protein 1 subunit zeta
MQGNLAYLNPGGVQARKANALQINCGAARGLMEVLKSNLGPRGTMKMLVSGAGLVKITKDGNTLLGEMQIQHPTATLIARAATATDDETGDGSTSTVILIGEMMRQSERYIQEGLHPRVITEGFAIAKEEAVKFLQSGVMSVPVKDGPELRESLTAVARTALSTKVGAIEKETLAAAVVDAVLAVRGDGSEPIDLHMIEVMHMKHRMGTDTRCIRGIVLDHGARSDDMPKTLSNCWILTCNISLEYERSEMTAGFYYTSPEQKAKMAEAERKVTDDKVKQVIALKHQVCTKENGKTFVVINQKGIDPIALEMLAKEGIFAVRRAKKRNMERMVLACGGEAINSTENMTADILGEAGLVQEVTLGEDKYTFVEDVKHGKSVTMLIRGANDHTIAQLKDATRDGLRAVKNAIDEKAIIPGAGAFEVALHDHLIKFSNSVSGKQKLGVRAYADALLVIPKTLAENSGHDVQQAIIEVQEAFQKCSSGTFAGLDIETGKACDPAVRGIFDNVNVKKSLVETAGVIAAQLLLVDEIMKAARRGMGGN